jgi:hypothetical protein
MPAPKFPAVATMLSTPATTGGQPPSSSPPSDQLGTVTEVHDDRPMWPNGDNFEFGAYRARCVAVTG